MKRCFAAVTLCIAFIVTGCSKSSRSGGSSLMSVLTPSDPWTEFALMTAARSKATSWRSKMVSTQAGQPYEMDMEIMCPDKEHVKMIQGGKVTMESTMIGDAMYVNTGGRVMKIANHMSAAAFQCPGAAGASSASPAPKFSLGSVPSMKDISTGIEEMQKMKDRVTVTKGGVSVVEGAQCQEWNVVYKDPEKNQSSTSDFCVGIADHLPRRMRMNAGTGGSMEMTFWDWNSNISINPPAS